MRFFLIVILFFFFLKLSLATHNRAGEIIIQNLGSNCLSYKVIIKTYTRSSSAADRPDFVVNWGDGDSSVATRINGGGNGEILPDAPDIRFNLYEATHIYSASLGLITITVDDPNRNELIRNITNSVQVPMFLRSNVLINAFIGCNSNPTMTNPPIGDACLLKKYEHNPGAIDPDGDSLAYQLVPSLTSGGVSTPGYQFPQGMTIDPLTGTVTWPSAGRFNNSNIIGEYNFAILITEYRRFGSNVFKVGEVLRDMQVTVKSCLNNPPVIAPISPKCVIAGQNLNFNINISDPDLLNTLKFSSTGQPYNFPIAQNPATYTPNSLGFLPNPSIITFNWNTICEHVRTAAYPIYLTLLDNDPNELYDYETFNIEVILGPPTALNAIATGASIALNWTPPNCSLVNKYYIYRKSSCDNNIPGFCKTDIDPSWGYTLIGTNNGLNNTTFIDDNNGTGLSTGITYSYRVVAETNTNIKGVVSTNVCAQLRRDVPVIINVDINSTDAANGNVFVRWTKPKINAGALDTISNPGPYEFRLYVSNSLSGSTTPTLLQTYTSPFFKTLNDTVYNHLTANTINALNYSLEFYSNNNKLSTKKASSVFLTATSTNSDASLSWQTLVPWIEDTFYVYRKNGSNPFQLIGKTTSKNYVDLNLQIKESYCYYIQSLGQYTVNDLPKPLINKSQEICVTVNDIVPPCAPTLNVKALCDSFANKLSWNNILDTCGNDVAKFLINYSSKDSVNFQIIDSTLNNIISYSHTNLTQSIAGCYTIQSVDSVGNISLHSNKICVENCPVFELPNVFTPNGDSENDVYKAIKQRYIQTIELFIYDRWGSLVYKTTDPNFNWDGNSILTKNQIGDATLYYTCIVNPYFVYTNPSFNLQGIIKLILK